MERNPNYPACARCILLDIEGTICPITFVKDTLFPYALNALPDVLKDKWDSEGFKPFRDDFPEEHRQSPEAFKAHVEDLTERNSKIAYLKNLQGYLWEHGYESGAYSTPLFPDVVPKLKLWREEGRKIAIYSSGSVFAQKLLFGHVKSGTSDGPATEVESGEDGDAGTSTGMKRNRKEVSDGSAEDRQPPAKKTATAQAIGEPATREASGSGQDEPQDNVSTSQDQDEAKLSSDRTEDLRYLISDWFDTTNAGPKTEESSYSKIANALGIRACDIFFLSDNIAELEAARDAGMDVQLVCRPGNAPVDRVSKIEIGAVDSFGDVEPEELSPSP